MAKTPRLLELEWFVLNLLGYGTLHGLEEPVSISTREQWMQEDACKLDTLIRAKNYAALVALYDAELMLRTYYATMIQAGADKNVLDSVLAQAQATLPRDPSWRHLPAPIVAQPMSSLPKKSPMPYLLLLLLSIAFPVADQVTIKSSHAKPKPVLVHTQDDTHDPNDVPNE